MKWESASPLSAKRLSTYVPAPSPHRDRIVNSPPGRKKTVRVRVLERNTRAAALESFSRYPRFNNDGNNIAIDYRNREFDSLVRVWRPSTNGRYVRTSHPIQVVYSLLVATRRQCTDFPSPLLNRFRLSQQRMCPNVRATPNYKYKTIFDTDGPTSCLCAPHLPHSILLAVTYIL